MMMIMMMMMMMMNVTATIPQLLTCPWRFSTTFCQKFSSTEISNTILNVTTYSLNFSTTGH
jgi:hypothetical protein